MLSIGDFAQLGQVSPRMLRHYDQLGLVRPDHVDPATGYRSYATSQLARLHKVLALRDLGFGLEQIGELLSDEPPVEQLRGMLRLRRAEIEQLLDDEQARLLRVEAHLRALEEPEVQLGQRVVIKHSQPVRIAEALGIAPGFGPWNIGPVIERLISEVLSWLAQAQVRPGILVAHYDTPADDGSVGVHAGFEIGTQSMDSADTLRVVDLPRVEVASLVHEGPIDNVQPVYEALVRWIEASGFRLASYSRELYHEWDHVNPALNITELQIPIAR